MEQAKEQTSTGISDAAVGGVICILSAAITLVYLLTVLVIDSINYFSGQLDFPPFGVFFLAFGGLWIVWIFASVLALVGGIWAIKRKRWLLSLIGAIASIICPPMVLGIVATIIIAKSKGQFATIT
jgi:hypothetical protein